MINRALSAAVATAALVAHKRASNETLKSAFASTRFFTKFAPSTHPLLRDDSRDQDEALLLTLPPRVGG